MGILYSSSIVPALRLKKQSNTFDCPETIRRGKVCFVLSRCPSPLQVTTLCFKYSSPAVPPAQPPALLQTPALQHLTSPWGHMLVRSCLFWGEVGGGNSLCLT